MVQLATDIMTTHLTGRPSPVPTLKEKKFAHYGVKAAVFPFNMFQEVDPVLGPEMRSTGEVLGLSSHFGEAFYKAQEGTQTKLPLSGTVLISVSDRDKDELLEVAQGFHDCGFKILATSGTHAAITEAGIPAEKVLKFSEGRPNLLDAVTNKQIDIIINTPVGKKSATDDSYIRKAAVKNKISYMTTMAAAIASVRGIKSAKKYGALEVKSLQEFHAEITDKE
jgi:carbamoyl-phosphate synthase large subunit